ncbi:hypothetical protein [Methylobacterium sp. CM6247]
MRFPVENRLYVLDRMIAEHELAAAGHAAIIAGLTNDAAGLAAILATAQASVKTLIILRAERVQIRLRAG